MTYTTIPDSDIDPESPLTTTLVTRIRDNPIAIANGDLGAPPVVNNALAGIPWQTADLASGEQMTTTNVLAATAAASVGAVGTYGLFRYTAGALAPGATVAGSALLYAGVSYVGATGVTGGVPSGTWRIMGRSNNASGDISVYLRIS